MANVRFSSSTCCCVKPPPPNQGAFYVGYAKNCGFHECVAYWHVYNHSLWHIHVPACNSGTVWSKMAIMISLQFGKSWHIFGVGSMYMECILATITFHRFFLVKSNRIHQGNQSKTLSSENDTVEIMHSTKSYGAIQSKLLKVNSYTYGCLD